MEKQERHKNIVAIIATDTIYVNDFIRRCEFTVRPPYCQDNGFHDKVISLNSLVGEKLFALEANENKVYAENEKIRQMLRGIQEQAMREALIQEMVVDKIKIPKDDLNQAYINSLKTIYLKSIFVPDYLDINTIHKLAQHGYEFERLKQDFPGVSEVYDSTVKWGQMDAKFQEMIFNKNITKGSVIKPVQTKSGYWLMKIKSWTEEIDLSPANRNLRLENIKSKLKDDYIRRNYYHYAKQIMKNKRIDFIEDTWNSLVSILQPVYLKNKKGDLSSVQIREIDKALIKEGLRPLLKIDNETWTIEEFREEIRIQPLVINHKLLTDQNFPHHLQAAIAGILTTSHLTKQAYIKGFEKAESVKKEVKEWKTYLTFLYHRDKYLAKSGFKGNLGRDYSDTYNRYLTPYLDSLKSKYNDEIFLNPDVLEKIELTKIPMIAYKTGGYYKKVVPPFPLVTNSIKANYRQINESK